MDLVRRTRRDLRPPRQLSPGIHLREVEVDRLDQLAPTILNWTGSSLQLNLPRIQLIWKQSPTSKDFDPKVRRSIGIPNPILILRKLTHLIRHRT